MRPILPGSNQPTATPWSLPAPLGGWNARDGLATMDAADAIQLDNWFPNSTTVDSRPGFKQNASITAGQHIQSLLSMAKADGTYKRFAASETGIWDVTAGGVIGAVSSAASNGVWQGIQLNVGGINYLWCCCGDTVNKSRVFKGDTNTWITLDGASTPVLTGPTSANIANVSMFKNRLILTEVGTTKFWIGPLNSVGGVFSAFDLGAVFRKGGYLVSTANWTIDAGDGPDDRFVAISSEGECVVYVGTDPTDATKFNLIGTFQIGKPVGRRCFCQIAGDLLVLTEQGVWPLSKALLATSVDRRNSLSDKIQAAFNSYYKQFGLLFGWQPVLLPKGPALIVNVPLVVNGVSYQFVMNLITGAWCRFKGWNASTMMVTDGRLFFASLNKVNEGWIGNDDNGSAITAIAAQAYTYGPNKARGKKVSLVRPMMQGLSKVKYTVMLNTNFGPAQTMHPNLSPFDGTALWDSAIFGTSVWGGGFIASNTWKSVKHTPSKAFSLQVAVQVKGFNAAWSMTDLLGQVTEVSLA